MSLYTDTERHPVGQAAEEVFHKVLVDLFGDAVRRTGRWDNWDFTIDVGFGHSCHVEYKCRPNAWRFNKALKQEVWKYDTVYIDCAKEANLFVWGGHPKGDRWLVATAGDVAKSPQRMHQDPDRALQQSMIYEVPVSKCRLVWAPGLLDAVLIASRDCSCSHRS